MVQSMFRRTLALFVLVLAASSASAALPSGRSLWPGWDRAWSWLAGATGLEKAGCGISPDGIPRCTPVVAPKHGCDISPDGTPRCTPVVAPKAGCEIGPNGTPRCTP